MSGYDPDVSGSWSDVDDYPGDEVARRHAEAVKLAAGLGHEQAVTGYRGMPMTAAVWWTGMESYLAAYGIAIALIIGGVLLGALIFVLPFWLLGLP